MALLISRKVSCGSAVRPARAVVRPRASYMITIKSPGSGNETAFQCADDEYILDAAEAARLELPNSCRSGTCCTCAGRLVSGQVNQEEQNFLDDQQMEEGFALLCVSYPRSDCVVMAEQHALNPLMK